MTEEGRHDISKEPDHTCPLIDSVIGKIKKIESAISGYSKIDDVESLHSILGDVEWELNIESIMEKIRSANISIREWGDEWKKLALDAIYDKEHFENKCCDLQNEIDELKTELKENERLMKDVEF